MPRRRCGTAPSRFSSSGRSRRPSRSGSPTRTRRSSRGYANRLDGIALAIELAAPRLKALSLEQLERKLSERFRILTGGSRTALPRQQTMRALVDWSYDLLTDDEKTLFRRVAVFAGGWSLDAASRGLLG